MRQTGPAKAGLAIAIVAAATLVPITTASAEWWNPFKQQQNQAEPLPPPPPANAPLPPANVGSPTGQTNIAPGAGIQPPPSFGNPDAITRPAGTGDPVALNPAVDATTRMDRIEQSLRDLTGQLEQVTFEIGKLRDELIKLQEDTDARFQSIDGAARPPQERTDSTSGPDFGSAEPHPEQETAATPPTGDTAAAGAPPEQDAIAAAIAGTQLGAPPQPLGTLTLDGAQTGGSNVAGSATTPPAAPGEQPLSLSQLTGGPEPTPAPDPNAGIAPATPGQGTAVASLGAVQVAGTPTDVYNRAYQYVLDGDYVQAEQSFRAFLVAFPTDKRAPDAQYWIGDSLFQRGLYREAGQEFNSGYRAYPKSGKAPDSLLRLGMSLTQLGQREAACAVYSELVKRYPDAPHALLQKVKAEQASGTC